MKISLDHVPEKEMGAWSAAESRMKGVPERETMDKYAIFSLKTGFFYGKCGDMGSSLPELVWMDNFLIMCMFLFYVL